MYTHNRAVVYPTLRFRICVLSHEGVGTRGERNRTTLFTHELLSVRSIARRNQQITAVSVEKKTVTTTSRCRFTMIDLAAGYESSTGYTPSFLQSEGEHEIPPRPADRPTRWFARFPTGAAGSKKSLSFLRRNDKAPICGSHARPCTAPCTHVDFSTLFRAIIRTALIAIADAGAHETPDCVDGDDREFPPSSSYLTETVVLSNVWKKIYNSCCHLSHFEKNTFLILRNRIRKSETVVKEFSKYYKNEIC